MRKTFLLVAFFSFFSFAVATPEENTAKYFESIRKSPPQQMAFLLKMPKGGDLHNHLSGSIYAETMVQWAAEKDLCVNAQMTVLNPPCDSSDGIFPVKSALTNSTLYRQMIDAWSMRSWKYSGQNGHDHFFDTFGKFSLANSGETARMLAEALSRAAKDHVSYLELMITPEGLSSQIGKKLNWDGNFEEMQTALEDEGISDAATSGIESLKNAEAEKDNLLKCATPKADAGCKVTVRYLYQVLRELSPGQVYAQMITAFRMAEDTSSHFVGLNLVQPEDGVGSMKNFSLQMHMLDYLRPKYKSAHISLHAGELAPGLVPPDGMTFHIRESVMIGHAERIGHGVDILHENDPYGLMKEMAKRNVLVEICLTSNEVILGVTGTNHPLATYLQYKVPVALATDDEGVSRSDMSMEYLKAAQEQGLTYLQLKTMAKNSLVHAFVDDGTKIVLEKKLDEELAEFEKGF